MFNEVQGCKWDAILVSETWRPKPEEVWGSDQGHIVMGAGKYVYKHGAAIIVKKWKHRINWTKCISERIIATSITVNKQPITLLSVYMPHNGYADHHVENMYNTIPSILRNNNDMEIIGSDFNAELGPGIGIEQTSVGQYTLKRSEQQRRMEKQWSRSTRCTRKPLRSSARTELQKVWKSSWTTFW